MSLEFGRLTAGRRAGCAGLSEMDHESTKGRKQEKSVPKQWIYVMRRGSRSAEW